MPAIVFLKSKEGQFQLTNSRYEEVYGVSFDDVKDKTLHDLELLSNLVFRPSESCGDLIGFCYLYSVFERNPRYHFAEEVKAA